MAAFAKPGYVASIIVNGQSIKEHSEDGDRTVRIPFGSEYSIRIKNKTDKRAKVSVEIDGVSVLPVGAHLIMGPRETINLERFINDGDLQKGRRFKFVQEDHPEVDEPGSEDNGGIVIKFLPEYIFATNIFTTLCGSGPTHSYNNGLLRSSGIGGQSAGSSHFINNVPIGGMQTNCSTKSGTTYSANVNSGGTLTSSGLGQVTYDSVDLSKKSDVGATVAGSESKQQFTQSTDWFYTEAEVILRLQVKGPKVLKPSKHSPQWKFDQATKNLYFHDNFFGQVSEFVVNGNVNMAFKLGEEKWQIIKNGDYVLI